MVNLLWRDWWTCWGLIFFPVSSPCMKYLYSNCFSFALYQNVERTCIAHPGFWNTCIRWFYSQISVIVTLSLTLIVSIEQLSKELVRLFIRHFVMKYFAATKLMGVKQIIEFSVKSFFTFLTCVSFLKLLHLAKKVSLKLLLTRMSPHYKEFWFLH